MKTYLLFETANSHGGSRDYVYKLIDALPQEKNTGIKFQVFKYDQLALKDYKWYKVYTKLFFNKPAWKNILAHAKDKDFDVWIDIFDLYGAEVLKDNLGLISGIKLQSSVLDNLKVLKTLSEIIKGKKIKVILNIAGRELDNIRDILTDFKTNYFDNLPAGRHGEIILQTGFQAYPTDAEDLTLRKIHILKSEFPGLTVSYADHIDGKSPLAFDVPVYAVLAGAGHIEKHVCLERKKTKYDFQSAIEAYQCPLLLYKLKESERILGTKLITEKEAHYLQSTIEKPIAATAIKTGDIINLKNFDFRRTAQEGLTVGELKDLMSKRYVFAKDIKAGVIIKKTDLKKARIGVIIACRMKSTRLKNKAILSIAEYNSVERCIINAKKIKSADEVILATSTLSEDQVLKKFALKHKVKFFAGEPNDVIKRYLDATAKHKIDVIIRITGDCPVISTEVAEYLLKKHFEAGADYTAAREFPVGFNSEIYNVDALKRVIGYLGKAEYSEYMTWYMTNNQEFFNVNIVDLPKKWLRPYRLTLDEQADLDMFRKLFEKLGSQEPNMKNIYKILDRDKSIPKINENIKLKWVAQKKLVKFLNEKTKIPPQKQ